LRRAGAGILDYLSVYQWSERNGQQELFWRVEPSKIAKEKAEKELKMGHYYYTAKATPKGLPASRLRTLKREAKELILKEAEALRNKTSE
jgi:hypothetical protein